MMSDPKTFRLYSLVMLPVAIAVIWFAFRHGYRPEPVPIPVPRGNIDVSVGGRVFSAEIADTPKIRELGLGERDSLCTDCSMLFHFDVPGRYSFWMKGMRFPLDFAWISEGRIIRIDRNVPKDSVDILTPPEPVTDVLETNAGSLSGSEVGDSVIFTGVK
ncbi:MAG: DUF192 domain-containing protein [Candidatus Moranbacteria bacterium]|nr:DUF192 domain-containing protein [Candidatus Moranbacteria bacterium]